MTSPEPSRPERGSTGRVFLWLIAGILLVVAIYLYLRFGHETPSVVFGGPL
jgi:hypothetical protein